MDLLLQGATTAASVGIGCGTCCGSNIGVFLSGYLMTHVRNLRESFRGVIVFYLGKLLAVVLLCVSSSLLGTQLLDENGCLAGIPVKPVVDLVMAGIGLFFVVQWVRERHGVHTCHSCGNGGTQTGMKRVSETVSFRTLLSMGVGYGLSPCAPLLLIAGYSATLPMSYAAVVGALFAISSMISPMLFFLLLSGVMVRQMHHEIPQWLTWFRLACYLLQILSFGTDLIAELSRWI